MKKYLLSLMALGAMACQPESPKAPEPAPQPADAHSYARPHEAAMTHLHLRLSVDFEQRMLVGQANIRFRRAPGAQELVLDAHQLSIDSVTADGKALAFQLSDPKPFMGSALSISLPENAEEVSVHYRTSPQAEALQWLAPEQTAGKQHPFLFTQSQAILARTWVPCQDSPGIRFTYSADVQVPSHLMALMSATNPQARHEQGQYHFEMPQAIPAYLLALAVGDVAFQGVGPRTGVYAEPSLLEKSAYEFADLEKLLAAAEQLYGAYQWERYDLIVLPPSFPFGGMENPRLTFATPTILAGDRSLVALVAHELAHSWSGNLVTNATWDDFWINEGFTVYFENRIMEALYGESIANMLALISYQDLTETVKGMQAGGQGPDTRLKLSLQGRNPDDGVSPIAYDKGFFLLKHIEQTVGREAWDAFLRKYFQEHAFKTMDTERFVAYLREHLLSKHEGAEAAIGLEQWIYQEGLPDNCPRISSDRFAKAELQAASFVQGTKAAKLGTEGWVYQEWVHFLRQLPDTLTQAQMQDLDKAFGFTKSGNSEVLCQWFLHAIRNQYATAYPALEDFCFRVGRRKFLMPLYAEMMAHEGTQEMARRLYGKSRQNYHAVAYNSLDALVK